MYVWFSPTLKMWLCHLHQAAMEGELPWREIKTKNGLQALKKATQRKEASGKSISQTQTSSDRNTHKSKHKLRGEGGKNNPSKSKA